MCIAFWLLDKDPAFWLILAFNRDEFRARPTLPFHFWDEDGERGRGKILGGRDMRSGGTWMGITKTGRLAFLTNVRENDWNERPERTSRGDLTARFLKGNQTPRENADLIAHEADVYNGFNLVVADYTHGEMAFVSNRHSETTVEKKPTELGKMTLASNRQSETFVERCNVVQRISPGLHSVSNGTLDGKWPKMERGKTLMAEIMIPDGIIPSERIVETVLKNTEKAEDVSAQIAETNCEEGFEKHLSSIFVEVALAGRAYGTRSMTVVGIRRDGQVSLFERYLESGEWKDHSFQFQVEGRPQAEYVPHECANSATYLYEVHHHLMMSAKGFFF